MTRRSLAAARCAPLLALTLGACDFFYVASARVPLVAPVDTACLRSTLAHGTQHRLRHSAATQIDGGRTAAVGYSSEGLFGNAWENVVQVVQRDSGIYRGVVYRDSSATLGASAVQVNRRFTPTQGPLTAAELATFLFDVREACGGRSPGGEPLFAVDVNETPYRAWAVNGTAGRVAMRLTVEDRSYRVQQIVRDPGRYVLRLDTLASDAIPRRPRWLEADSVALPTPGKELTLETDCRRSAADSLTGAGDLVALVHATDTPYFTGARAAWTVDRAARRIREVVPLDGIECENSRWGAILASGPHALRADALTFRPAPGAARVYVFLGRPDFPTENAMPRVEVDGQQVGRVEGGSFLMVELPPGRHRVGTGARANALWIDAASDSSYFVELRKKTWSWEWQATARRMDPAVARERLRRARMVPSTWWDAPPTDRSPKER